MTRALVVDRELVESAHVCFWELDATVGAAGADSCDVRSPILK